MKKRMLLNQLKLKINQLHQITEYILTAYVAAQNLRWRSRLKKEEAVKPMSVKEDYMTKRWVIAPKLNKERRKETLAVANQKRTLNDRCQENEEGRKAVSSETYRTSAQNGFCQEDEEG